MKKYWIALMAASLCMGGCAGQNTDSLDESGMVSAAPVSEEAAESIKNTESTVQGGIVIEEGSRSREEPAPEGTGQTQEASMQETERTAEETEVLSSQAEETESAAQEIPLEPLKGEVIHYDPDSPELTGPYLTEPMMHPQSSYTRVRWFTDEGCQAQVQFPLVLTDEIRKTGITLYPVFLP